MRTKIIGLALSTILIACLAPSIALGESVSSPSPSTLTTQSLELSLQAMSAKKAKKLYAPILKKLKKNNYRVKYKYVDIVGNATPELVALAFADEGMWSKDIIYTIANGKPKRIMNSSSYGEWNKLTAYKKTGALVYYGSGHGGYSYTYWKLKGGKYKKIAFRSKSWDSAWSYSVPSGSAYKPISKATFNAKVKPLTKGTAKKVPFKSMK